jgi:hypothetical protein
VNGAPAGKLEQLCREVTMGTSKGKGGEPGSDIDRGQQGPDVMVMAKGARRAVFFFCILLFFRKFYIYIHLFIFIFLKNSYLDVIIINVEVTHLDVNNNKAEVSVRHIIRRLARR